MKTLMLGNEAFARGLYEAGCTFVSSYPGTPSTEITECAAKYSEIYAEWAPNEKVAMEAAFGASLAGNRSFCGMKHVGLNVAADPLFTISYTGINAGMVIGVADDARGQIVKAFVVLRPGHYASPELVRELQDFVKQTVAPYKYPREIEFCATLPRTETGKLQRFRLHAASPHAPK